MTDGAVTRATAEVRHNLPSQLTSFVGRERELTELESLAGTCRLLTLTGPGGCGKTRLALELAARIESTYLDGVCLVSLASVADPGLVTSTVADAVGAREARGEPLSETLARVIGTRRMLLVLDNFEHLVSAGPAISDLLAACPRLLAVVTSREVLRLQREQVFPVPSLTLPDGFSAPSFAADIVSLVSKSEAGRLFVERARSVRPGFSLDPAAADAIAEICVRLDGLPLALELAAARVRVLSPSAMVERLECWLPLLTGGARDLPARQQTLRATIDWSYDLLGEADRVTFRHLAVFVGGWTLEAAEAVCRPQVDILSVTESLVDKSLVNRLDDADGRPRFGMLETIREYALERLEESGEAAGMRERHARHCLGVAERAEPELRGEAQVAWLSRLEAEHGNVRAALHCIVEMGEAEMGLRLARALSRFWQVRGYLAEGRAQLEAVVDLTGTRAYPAARAKALHELGNLTLEQGDYARARALQEESLSTMRDLGDRRGVAEALAGLASIAIDECDYQGGGDLHLASLEIMRDLGDRRGIAVAHRGLGHIAIVQGDYTTARARYEESLATMRELRDARSIARSLVSLGWIAIEQGHQAGAGAFLADSLTIARELGDARVTVDALEILAYLAYVAGGLDRAARLNGAAEALRATIGVPLSPSERTGGYDAEVAAVRAVLGDEAFAAAWASGQAMTPEQTYELAISTASKPLTDARPTDTSDTKASPAHGGLTRREHEVAILVAEGLSNPKIASRLGLSDRTIDAHLRNIMGKLDVTSRAQVAAWSVRHGLAAPPRP